MEARNEESPEAATLGFQKHIAKATSRSFPQRPANVNSSRFLALLERHVSRLTIRGPKATGLCPLHEDRTPSFSADLDKGVWYCFPCARGGGVKAFALAVGEPWGMTRQSTRERARFAVQARRRQAEEQAHTILQRRKDTRESALWAAWGEASIVATHSGELLGLFFRRPDLAEEFPLLVSVTESEYSDALFQKMLIEAQAAGEVG